MSCRCCLSGSNFTFFWKIKHAKLWTEMNLDEIPSAMFYADCFYGTRWQMSLKKNSRDQSFDLCVNRADRDDGPEEIHIKLSVKVLIKTNRLLTLYSNKTVSFKREGSYSFVDAFKDWDIVSEDSNLPTENQLLIQCSIKSSALETLQVCEAVTELDVERVSFIWSTCTSSEDLEMVSVDAMSLVNKAPSLEITLCSEKNEADGKILRFTFREYEQLNLVLDSKITLIDAQLNTGPTIQSRHFFSFVEDDSWQLPLHFKVSDLKEEFRKSLTFRFDMEFSYGKKNCKIEDTVRIPSRKSPQDIDFQHSNFLPIRNYGCFFDILLRVGDRTFPAHRDILCIKSLVLESRILEDVNAKEIRITDMDVETMDTFLTLLYSSMSFHVLATQFGSLTGDSWLKFKRLYVAAHKYEVVNVNLCSVYLATNINLTNILECFQLAEWFQDTHLKIAASNYFSIYADEIVNCSAFKNLLKNS